MIEDDNLAHLDLGFRFFGLPDDMHNMLVQTYRADNVNQLSVSSNMPVMGGVPNYVSSYIFITDLPSQGSPPASLWSLSGPIKLLHFYTDIAADAQIARQLLFGYAVINLRKS